MNETAVPRRPACCGIKDFLSAYRHAERSLSLKLDELAHLKSLAARLDDAGQDGIAQKIKETEGLLASEVSALCTVRRRVEDAIQQVEDDVLREILERRYLNAQTLEQIALSMHYTYRHVTRLHKRALELMQDTDAVKNEA